MTRDSGQTGDSEMGGASGSTAHSGSTGRSGPPGQSGSTGQSASTGDRGRPETGQLPPIRDLPSIEPVFLEGFAHGRRFAVWTTPPVGVEERGAVLCVQPFADEATLARRVLAAQARRLALLGWTTLILDLFGTGDSDGLTSQATLGQWRDDLRRASDVARSRGPGRFVVWGTRFGALLAGELAASAAPAVDALVLWQAPATGAMLIDPLRRLAQVGGIARGMSSDAAVKPMKAPDPEGQGALRGSGGTGREVPGHAVATEDCIALGGYLLREDLVDALAALPSDRPTSTAGAPPCPVLVAGIQRVPPPNGAVPKPLAEAARTWSESGHRVEIRIVQGEPFWSSLEPSTPESLFEATEAFLAASRAG